MAIFVYVTITSLMQIRLCKVEIKSKWGHYKVKRQSWIYLLLAMCIWRDHVRLFFLNFLGCNISMGICIGKCCKQMSYKMWKTNSGNFFKNIVWVLHSVKIQNYEWTWKDTNQVKYREYGFKYNFLNSSN